MNTEALARKIARDHVWDWVTGDRWYGYPGSEDEEREAVENYMPRAREKVADILRILEIGDEDEC